MGLNAGSWHGRRVLLTGHTGFKGSWLSLWLERLGAEVAGFSLPAPTSPSLFEVAGVEDGMQSVMGDVRELQALHRCFETHDPELVIHMAAQSLVRPSYADPVGTFATNVMGTVNVLEAARECRSLRAVVVVTSDKCYENREQRVGYREGDAMGGKDPYSSSKGCAELVTSAYRRSFFPAGSPVCVASARAGNVIGGGDWATDRLVPDLVGAFVDGRPAQIRNPDALRPWQHVLDALHGYLLLSQRLLQADQAFASAWNFGPAAADNAPVRWVADRMRDGWGGGARWDDVAEVGAPPEAGLLLLDAQAAMRRLDWQPRLPIGAAIDWTVDWYRAFHDGAAARSLTLDQIARFEALGTENSE